MEDGAHEEGDWDWAPYPASSRRSPAPTGFFSIPSPPPARFGLLPFCMRGQANLLFQSSCFNVLVALPPLLSRDPPPPSLPAFPLIVSLRGLRCCVFHSPQQNEPPRRQLIFQEATSASAATPRHLVDLADSPNENLQILRRKFFFLKKDCHARNLIAISFLFFFL